MSRRAWVLLAATLSLSALALAFRHDLAAAGDSLLAFADLTDADALTAVVRRTAQVEGRTIYYPAPTRELAAALEAKAAAPGGGIDQRTALRHLAEARRELGDLAGADEAMTRWASSAPADPGAAWEEAARWGARYRRWALVKAAGALSLDAPAAAGGLFGTAKRKALATDLIGWARLDPAAGDPDALLAARASRFPDDPAFLEEWIRSLEEAGKLKEADEAIRKAALPEERRAVLVSDLRARSGDPTGALEALERFVGAAGDTWPQAETLRAFAAQIDRTAPRKPAEWRQALDRRFEARPLVLLDAYFQGKSRGDLAAELVQQVGLRHGDSLDRAGKLLLAGLAENLDAVPEAFRTRLAAAKGASKAEQAEDLAALARLALKAGARPLAWGSYADEPLSWAARIDVTPGFATGALSFLLTGFDASRELTGLETRRLPERTFRVARLLVGELERREPNHPALPDLTVALMERHVQRGEGADALRLLPKADRGKDATRAEGCRIALLAVRLTKDPIGREVGLWKERLRLLAPDGSVPAFDGGEKSAGYAGALREAISRLDGRDRSHVTSLGLLLGELDRLPRAEALWLFGTGQVESWKLDADLEERYRAALRTFEGPEWWRRLARWYVRYSRTGELKALAEKVAATFRGTELFGRDPNVEALVPVEGQPELYISVSDYLRLKALERFPASPLVVSQAEAHLLTLSYYRSLADRAERRKGRGVVDDALLSVRQDAVLFQDAGRRAALLDQLMHGGGMERFLAALEAKPNPTPVEHRFLVDGWSRLSKFERAAPFADRLAEAYPGDGGVASEAVTLHRSLSGLYPAEADKAAALARRALPALEDPVPLLTQIGEAWQDLDRTGPAGDAFREILAVRPRDPALVLEVATDFWDYSRMEEAWKVLADGRKTLGRPHLYAFEAGVLREEVKDLPGALDEYLAASGPSGPEGEGELGVDSRATRRLARLASRAGARAILLGKIDALRPGEVASEAAALRLLSALEGARDVVDPMDDWADLPNDPVGRRDKARKDAAARPSEQRGIAALGQRLQARVPSLIEKATGQPFLTALRGWKRTLLDPRWTPSPEAEGVDLENRLMSREAEIAPSMEARVEKELARARYLRAAGRSAEAAKIPPTLLPKVEALPEGPARIRSFVALARFAEDEGGDAAAAWKRLSERYPWSLGVLEDHVAYLDRAGRPEEGLGLLERAAKGAAAGHRERLTERVVTDSLERNDIARARRAVTALLGFPLEPERRLAALALLARLSFREDPAFDGVALAKKEAPGLPEGLRPDLWNALAEAARRERRPKAALALGIEALNRRLDRTWLDETARSASLAGLDGELLRFFEAQRTRSPRDVRWAVAVRELKMNAGDLPGAIAAAREACAIAPEREQLQREAVVLFERALRFKEAAEFLAEWAKTRPGDESVASWRSTLLLRAGENLKAAEVERASMAEAARHTAKDDENQTNQTYARGRLERVVSRFLALNRPRAAWSLVQTSEVGKPLRLAVIPHGLKTEAALRAGKFPLLFDALGRNKKFLDEAAPVIERLARPEQLAALQETLLAALFPPSRPPDEEALNRLWSFARSAGLSRFSEAVTRKLLGRESPGPWGTNPPVEFVRSLQPTHVIPNSRGRLAFNSLSPSRQWVEYLVKRDRLDLLVPAIDPLVREVDRLVATASPAGELSFSHWFPVEAFARAAALPGQESWRQAVRRWLSRPGWGRFVSVTGSKWDATLLLPLLDPSSRDAFLEAADPSKGWAPAAKRAAAVLRVSTAMAALVDGHPEALRNADVVRLRGPRTVGDLLGADPAWTFPELPAIPGESGDDGMAGVGVDAGRLPGRLWGHNPGEAWYVLETLARYREHDGAAPYVPMEAAPRGQEALRSLVASRTAKALGDLPLALELDGEASLADAARLERRLKLLAAAGEEGRRKASALFGREVVKSQDRADETLFRRWDRLGRQLGLGSALDRLDPSKPLSSALLAYLFDKLGPARCAAFHPPDEAEFHAALASRWGAGLGELSKEKTVYALDELWAEGSLAFPAAAVSRAKLFSTEASRWLQGLPAGQRASGLAAVRALPDTKGIVALSAGQEARRPETSLLLLRAALASADGDSAAPLQRLAEIVSGPAAAIGSPAPAEPAAEPAEGAEEGESVPVASRPRRDDTSPLRLALRLFRQAGNAPLTARAERLLGEKLAGDAFGPWSAQGRFLSVELATTKEALDHVLSDLEKEWARGDWSREADRTALVSLLAERDEAAALRWVARLDEPRNLDAVRARARIYVKLKKPELARKEWVGALALPLGRDEQLAAFDAWRQTGGADLAGAEPPTAWKEALVFWKKKASDLKVWGSDLNAHLVRSPYDRMAARAVLRSLAPAEEEMVAPAVAALGAPADVASWRIARQAAPRSMREAAFRAAGGHPTLTEVRRRHFPKGEIDGLFQALARIGAWLADASITEASLAALEDLSSPALDTTLADVERIQREALPKPVLVRREGDAYTAVRPRDLTWDLYGRVLNVEEAR